MHRGLNDQCSCNGHWQQEQKEGGVLYLALLFLLCCGCCSVPLH